MESGLGDQLGDQLGGGTAQGVEVVERCQERRNGPDSARFLRTVADTGAARTTGTYVGGRPARDPQTPTHPERGPQESNPLAAGLKTDPPSASGTTVRSLGAPRPVPREAVSPSPVPVETRRGGVPPLGRHRCRVIRSRRASERARFTRSRRTALRRLRVWLLAVTWSSWDRLSWSRSAPTVGRGGRHRGGTVTVAQERSRAYSGTESARCS